MPQIEDFSISVNGASLAACWVRPDQGSAGGKPVILLHEGLGSIGQWKDFPEHLCARLGREVLVYDRQGYGGSPALSRTRDADYLHHYALAELHGVIEALDLDRPILFGHSDGGSIALIYAAHFATTAVISAAAHVFVEEISLSGIRDAVEIWHSTNLKDRLARYHGDKTEQIFFAWADTWLSDGFRDWNIEDLLPRIEVPVLALQGIEDEYGTPDQVHAISRQVNGPATDLRIPDCKHIPHLQAEQAVLDGVAAFLDGLSA